MNIMDYPSERICEALRWLYEGEWKHNMEAGEKSAFTNEFNDRVGLDIEDGLCMWRGWFKRNIEDDLAHALEVTAPWEWNGRYAKLPSGNGEACWFRVGTEEGEDRFHWALTLTDGPNMEEFEQTESAAKSAARAAYLRWMRGGLER